MALKLGVGSPVNPEVMAQPVTRDLRIGDPEAILTGAEVLSGPAVDAAIGVPPFRIGGVRAESGFGDRILWTV